MSEHEPAGRRLRVAWLPSTLEGLDDLLHAVVALVLVGVGIAVLVHVFTHDIFEIVRSFNAPAHFYEPVLAAVNDVLFVIIILEILRTVIEHFQQSTFALQPFLIIGIISTVRHLLMVGARLLLGEDVSAAQFRELITELALSGTLTFVLVLAYALLRRLDPSPEGEAEPR